MASGPDTTPNAAWLFRLHASPVAGIELDGSCKVRNRVDKVPLVTALLATLNVIGRGLRRLRLSGINQQQRTCNQ